ncbi:MAG: hypothetical protein WCR23_01365 [Planctomycetota bacterium]
MPASTLLLSICTASLLVSLVVIVCLLRSVSGTTAFPAALWGLGASIAAIMLSASLLFGISLDASRLVELRLSVGVLALCPSMSVLGAKRPLHRLWQLIVGSLAVVLLLPVISAELLRPGSLPTMHVTQELFLLLLPLAGWLNFLATKRWFAATVFTTGHYLLVAPCFSSLTLFFTVERLESPRLLVAAFLLMSTGIVITGCQAWIENRKRHSIQRALPTQAHSLDESEFCSMASEPFLCLREALGVAWMLRVAERFNEIATSNKWPCRLSLDGMNVEFNAKQASSRWKSEALRCVWSLLVRFATPDWLSRHGLARHVFVASQENVPVVVSLSQTSAASP